MKISMKENMLDVMKIVSHQDSSVAHGIGLYKPDLNDFHILLFCNLTVC